MHQLHTITDSLAHDLRSRSRNSRKAGDCRLSAVMQVEQAEPIVSAIEELDRLTDFLNKSLDVAEARRMRFDLIGLRSTWTNWLRIMIDLYEPRCRKRA